MKKQVLKVFTVILTIITIFLSQTNATEENLSIVPKLSEEEVGHTNRRINFLWSKWWEFWKNYLLASDDLSFFERLASWILTRDDIPNLMILVVKFLSQLWLVVWVIFIMYAGYKYMISVFNWGKVPSSAIKDAIVWVIIVIFSYAIMRFLTSIIWLT